MKDSDMRGKTRLLGQVLLVGAAMIGGSAYLVGAPQGGKTIKLKLILPPIEDLHEQKPVIVTIDGKEVKGEGNERSITATTAKDKDYVKVVAVFEPNNYTVISRPRKVVAKDGEVVLDFREKSKQELDHVVVAFIPTPQDFVNAMCKLAKITKEDVVYDLGCGDGRMVITAVKDFGAKRGVGIDILPDLVKKCQATAKKLSLSDKLEFREGNVLKLKTEDVADATVVLLYMGDDINEQLKPFLKKALKPGSRVISHRFLMGDDWPPEESVEVTNTGEPYKGYTEKVHRWTIKK
jgi:predicted RNA methylase